MAMGPRAYQDALEGRFGAAPSSPWVWALRALQSAFDHRVSVSPEDLGGLKGEVAMRTAQHAMLAHFVEGNVDAVQRWGDFLQSAETAEASHLVHLQWAWRALLLGHGSRSLDSTIEYARTAGRPTLFVEALCASTLLQLQEDPTGATERARRAVHIARSEEMIQQEYLANVVLACCRRREGRPYLAARILTELRRVSCGRWDSWITWEHLLADPLASDAQGAPHSESTAMAQSAHTTEMSRATPLRLLRQGCLAGDIALFEKATASARCPADRRLIESLSQGLNPEGAGAPLAQLGLGGWLTALDPQAPHGRWLLVHPERGCREVSALSLPLSDRLGHLRCPVLGSGQVRAAQVLAELARQPGKALRTDEVFRAVYGFAYASEKHSTVFRSALKRARQQLGDAGRIDRPTADTVRVLAARPLSVPAPRSVMRLEERILRILSRTPASSADLARTLRVSKRQVQKALPELVAQGCCSMHKEGRTVRYNVEDTTFVVPTFARVQPVLPC